MAGIAYSVTIGSFKASSKAGQGNGAVRSIVSELTMDGAGGRCTLELATSDSALPLPGDATTVSLDAGDGSVTVFTGVVLETRATPDSATVVGTDALAKLARLDVCGAYESTTAGSIVSELVQKAGATAGTIEDGPTFPSYVLHRGPRALRHIQRLAEQCGFDVYTDGKGQVHFVPPADGGPDHTFVYRKQVLRAELRETPPALDGVEVWGEGAASTQGTEKGHWLVADLASVSGKAALGSNGSVQAGSAGSLPREVRDGALRTGDDAATHAKARMTALASRPVRGFIEVLGAPAVKPGDTVQLNDIPKGHPVESLASGKVLRVRGVRHTLSASAGFVTRMEL
ncbi:contractile injection system protein, VgrG/Pvc8 family [Pyxidicoccus trucidator]|uniref:contractile injection system protein, VgrG/Pvc8 family n=1 Tax=Pyxidicoccus trucidator TaxID=2709662 RepID=UPI0013DA5B64|nr:contractile injection system protein, VgrG/Pvc8 family [Pyxidicoccus trucidator]